MEAAIGPRPMADARVGQKNLITRRWARRGTRPRAPHDQRTKWACLIGAICPTLGKGAALVMPFADSHAMQAHLAEIGAAVEAKDAALTRHVIEWGGKPVSSIKKGLATASRKAKIDRFSDPVCRHTAAVWRAEAGTPMSEIAQVLGHSDSRITERAYARYIPSHLRAAASALEL